MIDESNYSDVLDTYTADNYDDLYNDLYESPYNYEK